MTAPAGWYPDGNGQRYWDGQAWTENRAPGIAQRPWSGLSITAFFCGISSLLFWLILPVSLVLGVMAAVFMFTGLRDVNKRAARGSTLAVLGGIFGLLALTLWGFGFVVGGQ